MKTDNIQDNRRPKPSLDGMDRKILGALVEDASRSYAELGQLVALSAPAVHERVKRLKQSGVIKSTSAMIDGRQVGKPLLVFIQVATQNWGHSEALHELAQLPEFEEVHSVTGDTSIILKVRLADSTALESLLRQLHQLESVVSTKTFVTLSTYLERPAQPDITQQWPEPPLPPQ